jgi:hypothetical protein
MIRGKTNYMQNKINLGVGLLEDGRVMCAPMESIKKHSDKFVEIKQGRKKPSTVAKHISKKLDYDDLDDIIRVMPSGGLDWR